MNCKNCNVVVSDGRFFCPNCGEIIYPGDIENKELFNEYSSKLKDIISNSSRVPHVEIKWDKKLDRDIVKFETIRECIKYVDIDETMKNLLINKIDQFIDRCANEEFQIAFVGTIKAGKSTLINALLGKNYASTSVTPETAVLTKFRHSSEKDYIKVVFYNSEEWTQLWNSISNNADVFKQEYAALNGENEKTKWIGHDEIFQEVSSENIEAEIEKWTSSKMAAHYFVKEVTVGLHEFNIPEQIVFVDTPGLDDAVAYRSDVTRGYIDRANAVFACVKSDALTGEELRTLYRIFDNTAHNPQKVFVIGTKWDNLNNPEDDWKKQKDEWIKYLSGHSAYNSKKYAEENITYVAAYIQNVARDYLTADKNEKKYLMSTAIKFDIDPTELESNLARLMELSNIKTVERKLSQDLYGKYKDFIQEDINRNYVELRKEIKNVFNEAKKSREEVLKSTNSSIDNIRENYENSKKELEKIQKYKQDLITVLESVEESTKQRLDKLCADLREMAK